MVEMPDRAIGSVAEFAPLPPFVTAEEILADSLPLLDPPTRMSVTDCAEKYIRFENNGVWQNFDREVAPYLVEPSDTTRSRLFRTCAFVGPSQCGKTSMLITVAGSCIINEPGPVLIVHMTRGDAQAWVEENLNPTIRNSPALYDRLGKGADDDTFSRKRFKGMRLTIGYPVAQQLSGRKQLRVLMSDYDHFKQVLGRRDNPEGTPLGMARQRVKTFLSRGGVMLESTPAFEVIDPTWQPSKDTPHMLPPVSSGIVLVYNEGTRGRWYWECRDCQHLYEPTFDRLHFDREADPLTAGQKAMMECPECGSLTAHRHKFEMNRAALRGRGGWLHEGQGGQLVRLDDPEIRGTDTASWSLEGAAATFANWADMVGKFLNATRKYESFADDVDLRQFWFLDRGRPFTPRRAADEDELTLSELKAQRDVTPKGTAPDWVQFITVSVDVQGSYFPVQVTGWAADGRRTVVDRFDLTQPPGGDQRKLDPGKYAGDWDVLEALEQQVWPVEGQGYGLRAAALGVDFQGARGVSDNAEKFWRARKRAGTAYRWFLTRGHGGFKQRDRVWHVAPDRASGGKRKRGIRLLNMATDLLKDTIAAALARPASEPSSYPLPEWMDDDQLGEFIAEWRQPKGWEKKPGEIRNESLDLSVQAQALAEHKGLRRIDPSNPPAWMIGGDVNEFWVPQADPEAAPPAADPTPTRPRRVKYLSRR